MTYLMFIRDLDDADNVRAKEAAMLGLPHKSIFAGEIQIGDRKIDGSQLKWSTFHDFPAAKMYSTMQEWVFPFIKNLHGDKESAYSKYMGDAIFKVPTPLMLDKIVTTMDAIYEQMEQIKSADTRGDVYEYLLSKLATAGVNGQFRTPRHIIRMMVEMMNPKANEIICDPACGTSGFLVAASEYLRDRKKQEVLFDRQNKEHYMNHRDLLFIKELKPEMIGIGPFIPHKDTPFAKELPGTLEQTLRLLSIIRLIHPHALLPATTALGTIDPKGREKGILAGANVVMPNLSPVNVRDKYTLYDNKICTGDEAAECKACMAARMKSIGYEVVTDRGDYKA